MPRDERADAARARGRAERSADESLPERQSTRFEVVDPGDEPIGRVTLFVDGRAVGRCGWHLLSEKDGAVHVLWFEVAAEVGRRGHGTALFKEMVKRANEHLASRGGRLRRVTCALEQKAQVVARAFATRCGFHHTATVGNVLRDQDLMVYTVSYR